MLARLYSRAFFIVFASADYLLANVSAKRPRTISAQRVTMIYP